MGLSFARFQAKEKWNSLVHFVKHSGFVSTPPVGADPKTVLLVKSMLEFGIVLLFWLLTILANILEPRTDSEGEHHFEYHTERFFLCVFTPVLFKSVAAIIVLTKKSRRAICILTWVDKIYYVLMFVFLALILVLCFLIPCFKLYFGEAHELHFALAGILVLGTFLYGNLRYGLWSISVFEAVLDTMKPEQLMPVLASRLLENHEHFED